MKVSYLAKTFVALVIVGLCVLVGGMWLSSNKLSSEIGKLNTEIASLNNDNAKLVADNSQLAKSTFLKSFENEKALERFIKSSSTSKQFTGDDYASEACISLMMEARESGYWMGITAENMTDENIWSAIYSRSISRSSVKWYAYNVAIVGDADIYLVDPINSTGEATYYYIMTIGGDFNKYSESKVSDMPVLPYDRIAK